jgi:Ca2+/Na+ antiporter
VPLPRIEDTATGYKLSMAAVGPSSVAGRASVRRWDIALAVWAIVCAALALTTANEIHSLSRLSDTLTRASRAIDTTASGLDRIADIPIVGTDISAVVTRLRETSESALANARETSNSDVVATLVGVAIVLIAVVPATVAYLAVRPALRRRPGAR